ncbi:MAG TPA: delta-60 repeat domain-containing protein [Solirubrobacteraceae bacterium]|nr:delta-60 repeat domain-containing protein [Solirubrobacteraceae bacterium]
MRTARRVLILAVAAVGGSSLAGQVASAAPPYSAKAPGRVVYSLDGGAISPTDNPGGERGPAVGLPDGGTVVVADGPDGRSVIIELDVDGTLDPSFTDAGLTAVQDNLDQFAVTEIVRQPDGKLVLVGSVPTSGNLVFPELALVRLNADGTLDSGFGIGGLKVLPIQASCTGCLTVAVRPGGGLVVGGSTGQQSPAIATDPAATPQTRWVVAALTSYGALDPSFGLAGIAFVGAPGSYAKDLAVLPDGEVVTDGDVYAGDQRYKSQLVRLLPSGAPDPAFHGGTPEYLPDVAVPGILLVYPDGVAIVDLGRAIVRYTAAGLPDETFGTGGVVQTTSPDAADRVNLFPSDGDGAVAILENESDYGSDEVERIGPTGAVDAPFSVGTPFGGGSSSFVTSERPRGLPPLDQNTFAGSVLERPDGSFVLLGDVAVSQPTGEGEGRSSEELAAAALTPSFGLDPSFGGPPTPLQATLAVIRQRASTARTRHGIRVTLGVSAPGLARIVIKASGRVVAQSVLPVFVAGASTLPVELTSFGNTWLGRHPRSRLTASLKARDVLTNTATATASGALR